MTSCDLSHLCCSQVKWGNKCFPRLQEHFSKIWSQPCDSSSCLTDNRRGWELDGSWWLHHRGEANWNVVEAPGRRRGSWSRFSDLHGAAGQTQSHDAGKETSMIQQNWKQQLRLKRWKYCEFFLPGLRVGEKSFMGRLWALMPSLCHYGLIYAMLKFNYLS